MKLSMKHGILTLILMAMLLAALAVTLLKVEAARDVPAIPRATHTLAWYCPPPPIPC